MRDLKLINIWFMLHKINIHLTKLKKIICFQNHLYLIGEEFGKLGELIIKSVNKMPLSEFNSGNYSRVGEFLEWKIKSF